MPLCGVSPGCGNRAAIVRAVSSRATCPIDTLWKVFEANASERYEFRSVDPRCALRFLRPQTRPKSANG